MKIFEEAILEVPARWWRWRQVKRYLKGENLILLDVGSGPKGEVGRYFDKRLKQYIAIDPLLKTKSKRKKWLLIRQKIGKKIELPAGSVDAVVALAFLEHVDFPGEILREMVRTLKSGGRLILTTPTPRARKLLEFLAFDLGWLSQREIREHKNYFDRKDLVGMLSGLKLRSIKHCYFEFGLNNLLVVEK